MRKIKLILRFSLSALILLCIDQGVAISQGEADDLLEIQAYADRTIVKNGETINIYAFVISDLVNSVTFTSTAAENCLELQSKGSETVPMPMKEPVKFVVSAKNPGKCSVLLYVQGFNNNTQKPLVAISQIEGLEVQALTRPWAAWASHSLTGVLIGSLLTFGVTWANELRQKSLEKDQRRKWLTQTLPTHLAVNRVAIEQERDTQVESWENKLIVEDYCSDLKDLIGGKSDSEGLPSELIRMSFLLREYEQDRKYNRLTPQSKENLCLRLDEAMILLKKLGEK